MINKDVISNTWTWFLIAMRFAQRFLILVDIATASIFLKMIRRQPFSNALSIFRDLAPADSLCICVFLCLRACLFARFFVCVCVCVCIFFVCLFVYLLACLLVWFVLCVSFFRFLLVCWFHETCLSVCRFAWALVC